MQEKIGGGKLFVDSVLLAEENHIFLQAFFADEIFRGAAVRAVADEDEFGGHFGADEAKISTTSVTRLTGRKLERCMRIGSPLGAHLLAEAGLGAASIEIAIHEVGDDFDGTLDVEFLERLLAEVVGDGGDAVALLDGKFRDGEIAAVAANESDVGAVKRGDEGKAVRRGHGTREQGADGMRDRVVHVEQIERFGFDNFDHLRGERQRIRRMVEERVGGDFDFVKMDMRSLALMRMGMA